MIQINMRAPILIRGPPQLLLSVGDEFLRALLANGVGTDGHLPIILHWLIGALKSTDMITISVESYCCHGNQRGEPRIDRSNVWYLEK